MTTFAAKGLEFDTAILPGFNDGVVPYLRRGSGGAAWWLEERRKMYVAITRTEVMLALTIRDGRPASRFVEEMGIEESEHVRWAWGGWTA
jgi:superfamily I DNA/RNA helicase